MHVYIIFLFFTLRYSLYTVLYVTGVQCSDSQLLNVILYLYL